MSDRERFAQFLGISQGRIPIRPEEEGNPKLMIVRLAQQSTRSSIRRDLVPGPRSGRTVGVLYNARLIRFATDKDTGWRPEIARAMCGSLDRCMRRLQEIGSRPSDT